MTLGDLSESIAPEHQKALQIARTYLERPDFAARLAEYAGRPVEHIFRVMPRVANARLNKAVETTILSCLKLAIGSLRERPRRRPASRTSSVLAGINGGVSGFFGLAALPVELPLTTTLMLREIADIARHHGEDLSNLEARLACIEVLGLGTRRPQGGLEVGYYASRAMLSKLVADASSHLIERGVTGVSAPAVSSLLAEIIRRFGLVASERVAASALPVAGALGGATVNFLFMNHFQRVAHGHFTIRRLERHYGREIVRGYYQSLSGNPSEKKITRL
ncbi:MAG: EcsC family protein [Pseudomonadota bacterium]